MIVMYSDLDLRGSGYMNITIALANQLASRFGRKVTVLGMGYSGAAHDWPFQIIPVKPMQAFQHAAAMLQNLISLGQAGENEPVDAFICLLDIPHQEAVFNWPTIGNRIVPFIGLFPIESGPLCNTWANVLSRLDARLVISQYGADRCNEVGLPATHIPIGLDAEAWRMPVEGEVERLRETMGMEPDDFVVLTVADNQERKNLSAAFRAISILKNKHKVPVKWVVVTRVGSKVGWKFADLANEHNIADVMTTFERGIEHSRLWVLNTIADAFLLTSKAEGLCALPGSEVWTIQGKQNIETIKIGDQVLSHQGDVKNVDDVFSRHYSGEVVNINPRYGLPEIRLTPDHLVFAIPRRRTGAKVWGKRRLLLEKPKWIPARELKAGDFLYLPRANEIDKKEISITSYVENLAIVEDGRVCIKGKNQSGAEFPHPRSKRHKDKIEIDDSLMKLIGLYIAEGCYTGCGMNFSLHSEEAFLQNELAILLDKKFNAVIRSEVRERHRWSGWVSDKLLGLLFSELCGKSSHEKHLPEWALWLSPQKLWPLIEMMFLGDGSYQKGKQRTLRYSTVSERLAGELQFVLARFDIMAYLNHASRGDFEVRIHEADFAKVVFMKDMCRPNKKKSARYESISGGLAVPIKKISFCEYSGPVFNIEVEDDESFTIGGLAVHNCMPVIEAMACGTPVVATNATALIEHLTDEDGKPRGFPINSEYVYQDPWGNSYRHFADPVHAAKQLKKVYTLQKKGKLGDIIARGREYAESRNWDIAGDVLEVAVKNVIALHKERVEAAKASAQTPEMFAGQQMPNGEDKPLIPPTVPQAVPPMLEKP